MVFGLTGCRGVPFLRRNGCAGRLYLRLNGKIVARLPIHADFRTFQSDSGVGQDFVRHAAVGFARSQGDRERECRMSLNSTTGSLESKSALLAIGVAGLVAGTLDLLQACILFGWHVPKVIAAGLLGPSVIRGGGAGIFLLGIVLHYFIACSAAAIFYTASRRLRFMTEHWVVCGLFFGMAVELVMGYVVLPLSALHARGPFDLKEVLLGFGVHMVVVGVPIAGCVRRFGE